jgi:hypothetical protein
MLFPPSEYGLKAILTIIMRYVSHAEQDEASILMLDTASSARAKQFYRSDFGVRLCVMLL